MIKSPVKWAGGKSRVMPQLLKHLPKADCLIEPFVGSGTVFMNTDYQRYIRCDSNLNLINFFRQLTGRPEDTIAACREMFSGGNDEGEFYKRRKAFNSLAQKSDFDPDAAMLLAVHFLYLNRHTYNGLYRINLEGDFNSSFGRYAAPYFPENEMRLFAEKANDTKAMFIYGDFRDTIPSSLEIEPGAALYCDPPYIPASKTANFTHYGKPFTLDDNSALVAAVIPRKAARSIPLSISTPSASAVLSAPKAATWPVKSLAFFVSAMVAAVLAVAIARTAARWWGIPLTAQWLRRVHSTGRRDSDE